MNKGEGLVAFLYAIKGIIEAGAVWIITSFGLLAFFFLIIKFIGGKFGLFGGSSSPFGSSKMGPSTIVWGLFLLFIVFAIYSLVALTADIFGVNSSPVGGLFRAG